MTSTMPLKSLLASSSTSLLGVLVTLSSPELVEILTDSGFDWLFIDMEHSSMDFAHAKSLISTVNCPCLIRVPYCDPSYISRSLDLGCEGIIVPHVTSSMMAEDAVRWAKYPPRGERGIGVGRAHRYGSRFDSYLSTANDDVVVVAQIEDKQGLNDVAAIANVAGIDALLAGPYDLSASLGVPGQVDHPDVLEAIDRVRACRRPDLALGILTLDPSSAARYAREGFKLLVCDIDVLMITRAAKAKVEALRQAMMA